jgi:hypothetical protein
VAVQGQKTGRDQGGGHLKEVQGERPAKQGALKAKQGAKATWKKHAKPQE